MTLDEIDFKILEVLQKEGRISNQNLADQVGLSPSPCLRRTKAMEMSGVIHGYTALLSPEALGQAFQAIVEIRLQHQNHATSGQFEKEIRNLPQVQECYLVTGDWDYMVKVVAHDLDDFREFCTERLTKLTGISNVRSNICMKQVKYSTVLPFRAKYMRLSSDVGRV